MAVPDRYHAPLFDKIGGSRFWALVGRNDRQVIRAKLGRKTGQSLFFAIPTMRHRSSRTV
jgi:hypothetical protein